MGITYTRIVRVTFKIYLRLYGMIFREPSIHIVARIECIQATHAFDPRDFKPSIPVSCGPVQGHPARFAVGAFELVCQSCQPKHELKIEKEAIPHETHGMCEWEWQGM